MTGPPDVGTAETGWGPNPQVVGEEVLQCPGLSPQADVTGWRSLRQGWHLGPAHHPMGLADTRG